MGFGMLGTLRASETVSILQEVIKIIFYPQRSWEL